MIKYIFLFFLLGCRVNKPYSLPKDSIIVYFDTVYLSEDCPPQYARSTMFDMSSSVDLVTTPPSSNKGSTQGSNQVTVYEEGRLVYNIPLQMTVDKSETVIVRINRDREDNTLLKGVKGADTLIRTSSEMEVSLKAACKECFDIQETNSASQVVEEEGYTQWEFEVTPRKSGKNKLNLIVSIIINNKRKQNIYSDIVTVVTKPSIVVKTWWEKYWQWCLSTILLPLIVWVYKKDKK